MNIPPRWYMINNHGAATLCMDAEDARKNAVEADMLYPRNAPHVAVMLAPVSDAHGDRRDAAAKRLLAAARTYYEGYCHDEATEELDANGRGLWTGCDRAQRDAAIELREAVAAMAEKEAR
jgi:hypothetical protein